MRTGDAPVLVLRWEAVVGEVLDRTAKFPKNVRYSFAQRVDALALDVYEALVEARYAKGRQRERALVRADGALVRLRALVRLACARHYLSERAYGVLAREFEVCGRMLGGWRRRQGRGQAA